MVGKTKAVVLLEDLFSIPESSVRDYYSSGNHFMFPYIAPTLSSRRLNGNSFLNLTEYLIGEVDGNMPWQGDYRARILQRIINNAITNLYVPGVSGVPEVWRGWYSYFISNAMRILQEEIYG